VRRVLAAVALPLLLAACGNGDRGDLVPRLLAARAAGAPLPLPSAEGPFSLEAAYLVQAKVVEDLRRGDQLIGFKAGLTTAAARARIGATEPVAGALLASGWLRDKAEVRLGRRPVFVEVELGFVLGSRVDRPVADVESLRALVRGVKPVVELPEVPFEERAPMTPADLVAANVGAARYVVGREMPIADVDPAALDATLSRGTETVARGGGGDDPWETLLWLVNRTVGNGYAIEPGFVLLTGALHDPVPATPGSWLAWFGPLGRLGFTIVE
jgi:2-keto-4-pentenoate hydratase